MSIKAALVVASFLATAVSALDAPCYGYGSVMGRPSKYLQDDMEKVEEYAVGQGLTYVSNIDFLFEGKNYIKLGYRQNNDINFRESSWAHGSSDVNPKRYNLHDANSRLLNPGYVFNESKQSMIGFIFVEYFESDRTSYEPWALTAFRANNVPYYEFVENVSLGLRETETFKWAVASQEAECSMVGDVPNTELVGLASTVLTKDSDTIQSIQPIYYSTNQAIC